MELIRNNELEKLTKDKIEQVQLKETEYRILGSYSRTKGLKLFSYSVLQGKITKLNIKYSKEVHIIPDGNGGLTYYDPESQKVNIDSSNIHFECLNYRSAEKRVEKWKEGYIENLCNLKPPTKNKINFY